MIYNILSNLLAFVSKFSLLPKTTGDPPISVDPSDDGTSSSLDMDLDFDVLRAYISSTKDLLHQWQHAKENLASITKKYEENKSSVDTLKKNNTCDPLADASDLFLEPIEIRLLQQSEQLQSVHTDFEELQHNLLVKKEECRFILNAVSQLYQEMNVVSAEHCDGGSNDPLLSQVAQFVYAKFDNHDLRKEPALYSEIPPSSPVAPANENMDPQLP